MRKTATFILASTLLVSSVSLTGCEAAKNTNKTQRGAAIGAGAGAIIGGILGNNIGKGGNGALGAVLGGVVGGAAGGVIGNKMDKQARQIENTVPGAQVERVGEGIKLILGENSVNFELNSATLSQRAKDNLDRLTKVFKDPENQNTDIEIYGYTDNTGKEEYNLSLSKKRAASVRQYLASQGVNANRMKTDGFGIADPVASNDTKEGQAKNRRVEFAIKANEQMVRDAYNESGSR